MAHNRSISLSRGQPWAIKTSTRFAALMKARTFSALCASHMSRQTIVQADAAPPAAAAKTQRSMSASDLPT
jgi:hypothetical protein